MQEVAVPTVRLFVHEPLHTDCVNANVRSSMQTMEKEAKALVDADVEKAKVRGLSVSKPTPNESHSVVDTGLVLLP